MSDGISAMYDDMEEKRQHAWNKESEDIIIEKIGCGELRERLQKLFERLDSTAQLRYVHREIEDLKKLLKL